MKPTRIKQFFKKNYLLLLVGCVGLGVILLIAFQSFFSPPVYVYAKVKVGQGYWWASTAKAPAWYIQALRKGDIEEGFAGKIQAKIENITYYNAYSSNQYDIYLLVKLSVSRNKTTGYSFKRSPLLVGTPIEFNFPRANITGTVIDIQKEKIKEKYVDKIVYLVNQSGYNRSFPYSYDTIKIGDTYYDGHQVVFQVLDKSLEQNIWAIPAYIGTDVDGNDIMSIQNIILKARVRVKEKNGKLFFGEESVLSINSPLTIATPNYYYSDFLVRKIE